MAIMSTAKLLSLVALLCAFNSVIPSSILDDSSKVAQAIDVKVRDIEDNEKPSSDSSLPLLSKSLGLEKQTVYYTAGSRVFGDWLVGQGSDSYFFGDYRDVEIKLRYPATGYNGQVVTHVLIEVQQSPNAAGDARIISGGIGQRYIEIAVRSYGTTYLDYHVNVFGY